MFCQKCHKVTECKVERSQPIAKPAMEYIAPHLWIPKDRIILESFMGNLFQESKFPTQVEFEKAHDAPCWPYWVEQPEVDPGLLPTQIFFYCDHYAGLGGIGLSISGKIQISPYTKTK